MTVKELIKELKKLDQNRLVVISSDEEGNSFNEFYSLSTASYDKEAKEIGLEELTDEDIAVGYEEEDVKEGVPCVVLWP